MLQRSSVPDLVFRELAAAVLDGRYAPGERLPPQRALAAELGVNMASLREGVKRLEQLRLVEVRHGDAMRVTDWRTQSGLDVLAYAAGAFVGPLFEARRLLLREAAALAAQRRSDDAAERLLQLSAGFAAAEDAQPVDLVFMATVIEAADNIVFTLILNSIREVYLQHLDAFAPIVADREGLAPLYAQVARAVAERDPSGAAAAMEALAGRQEEAMRA
jgi:GntR family transcriptional regulator, transcriptional repressor for pyruvate dehydrogenase complex